MNGGQDKHSSLTAETAHRTECSQTITVMVHARGAEATAADQKNITPVSSLSIAHRGLGMKIHISPTKFSSAHVRIVQRSQGKDNWGRRRGEK